MKFGRICVPAPYPGFERWISSEIVPVYGSFGSQKNTTNREERYGYVNKSG